MSESINEPGLTLVQGPECEPGRPFSRCSRGTLHGARLFQTLELGGGGGGGGSGGGDGGGGEAVAAVKF